MGDLPNRKKEFTKGAPQMETSLWAREQNKALFMKQVQRTHMIKLRAEHSYLPKSDFITTGINLSYVNISSHIHYSDLHFLIWLLTNENLISECKWEYCSKSIWTNIA